MKKDIKIPALGESISEVKIGAILKPTGSHVAQDEELLEIETEKLNQVLYAPEEGVVTFTVKQGDKAKIGDVIGYVEAEKTSGAKSSPKKGQDMAAPVGATRPWELAKEEWLQELEAPKKEEKIEKVSHPKAVHETRKPLSSLRKMMGKRLLEVTHTTAMLTTFNEADMSEVIKLRERYKEAFLARYKTKLGFMSFFVKAAVSALQAYPVVNSYLDGDDQVFRSTYDIGVAVASEKGLIVPVIRNADRLSFAEIEQQIDDYVTRANEGKLLIDELTGGSFTITNGGLFGSMLSTPILNPPQCAILGMHKITKRPVVVDDQVVVRPMMYLALSYDHRVLDGKEAVSFLVHIKNIIEDPHRLELGV